MILKTCCVLLHAATRRMASPNPHNSKLYSAVAMPAQVKTYASPSCILLTFDWEEGKNHPDLLGFAIRRSPGYSKSGAPEYLFNKLDFTGSDPWDMRSAMRVPFRPVLSELSVFCPCRRDLAIASLAPRADRSTRRPQALISRCDGR